MIKPLLFVGGAAGVGKSTACQKIVDIVDCSRISLFNAIYDEGERRGMSPDAMAFGWDTLAADAFSSAVAPLARRGALVLDTHYAIQDSKDPMTFFAKRRVSAESKFRPGIQEGMTTAIMSVGIPMRLVLLVCDPVTVTRRITMDSDRLRSVFDTSVAGVSLEMEAEAAGFRCAQEGLGKTDTRAMAIANADGRIDMTVDAIIRFAFY